MLRPRDRRGHRAATPARRRLSAGAAPTPASSSRCSEPRGQRPRRHARGRAPHDRDRATSRSTTLGADRRAPARVRRSPSRERHRAAAWTRRRAGRTSSSPSSPPRSRARARGWAWPPSTASSTRAAARSRSTASPAAAPLPRLSCPRADEPPAPLRPRRCRRRRPPRHRDRAPRGGRRLGARAAPRRPAEAGLLGPRGGSARDEAAARPRGTTATSTSCHRRGHARSERPRAATGSSASTPGLPVLYLSGYTDDELQRAGLPEDAPLVRKPLSGDELLLAVRASLAGPD